MLFSSLVFLFFFLPSVLLAYYVSPKKIRNYILLIFSLIFYSWGGVSYTLILLISIILNFVFVKQIERSEKKKRNWLAVGLFFNVTLLVIFKYLDFFIENINEIGWMVNKDFIGLPIVNIVLPLGISFFTFQQMSLLWDVYRDPKIKTVNFANTALYISFFPQLIAGPIVRYHDIVAQIKNRTESFELINSGVQRFILGLFKKIVFANTCASITDSIMDMDISILSTPVAWLGIIAYAFQIYFDFSGYSDMAIGLGRMFGFRILENFNFPYISRSIQEFWRRWHISLSTWFRDYVYIPLGGNRKGPYRTYLNLFIVFLLTGFWHGANWGFVFWGIYHGTFLIIERLGFGKVLNKIPKPISWIYAILVVLIGWVFFRLENFSDSINYIDKLFGGGTQGSVYLIDYLDRGRIIILVLAALSSSLFFDKIRKLYDHLYKGNLKYPLLFAKNSLLIIMFIFSITYINSGSYNPFIYFRF